ncbi:MAG TPA: hypothetical protein VHW24_14725 [Bryobacteraceae bacterium]|nr:hypothetical protein [Bryobacteraceae bacterium]
MAIPRLLTGLLLVALLAAQTPPKKKTGKELQALFEAHKGDFDYLLGEWEFTTVSKEHGTGKGVWTAVRLSTGQILDEFRIVGDKRETWYVTSTLRAYNAGLDRWELVGMVEGGGLQDVGTGQRVGGEVHIEQKFGVASGNTSILRIRYYNIQPDRFSWTADRSSDGGKTWSKEDQKIEAHRVGPARELGALAPAR